MSVFLRVQPTAQRGCVQEELRQPSTLTQGVVVPEVMGALGQIGDVV